MPTFVEKNMEVFHVASMRAGKIFNETWKIQRACIENSYKTSMQHAKFLKFQRILRNLIKHAKDLKKNIYEFYKIFKRQSKFFILYQPIRQTKLAVTLDAPIHNLSETEKAYNSQFRTLATF